MIFCRKLFKYLASTRYINVFYTSNSAVKSTVFAVSTAPGRAGIAVIRVSGPSSAQVVHKMTSLKYAPEARRATLTRLIDPTTGDVLDKAILLFFKAPGSFTGEDSCELHVHGGVAVVSSVLNALSKIPHFKLAQPGEFTRRAFLNGKLDLTAVEGLADLIAAETEAQRIQALRQMDGELHRLYSGWRSRIMKVAAHVEAFIDFSEDENIDAGVMNTVQKETNLLIEEIETHLSDNRRGERLRSGVHVVIVGEPNVGKSSLLNLISQRPAAIVSPIAGTTRDVVECHINIGGFPILLSDTAGLRQSSDEVEKEGMNRAIEKAQLADCVIVVLDPESVRQRCHEGNLNIVLDELFLRLGLSEILSQKDLSFKKKTLVVVNKIDTCDDNLLKDAETFVSKDCLLISCKTNSGIDEFLQRLTENVENLCTSKGACTSPTLTQQRHRIHLNECVVRLKTFFETKDQDLAVAAYHLRKGADQLGRISGEFTTEDLLDIIFKDFCIGK